jgi:hypothetical protein
MTKFWIWGVLVLIIAGCSSHTEHTPVSRSQNAEIVPNAEGDTVVSIAPLLEKKPASYPTAGPIRAELEDYGPAPELTNDTWLNVSQPLRLAELRGKVVLIDMWTFG